MAEIPLPRYNMLIEDFANADIKGLAEQFKILQARYNDAKAASALIYAEFELLRKQILPTRMDEMGISTVNIKGVGRIQISNQLSAKQIDKFALQEWLKDNGHGDIVAETVNASTLGAFIKAQIGEGEPIPDDSMVQISTYEVASVVKA